LPEFDDESLLLLSVVFSGAIVIVLSVLLLDSVVFDDFDPQPVMDAAIIKIIKTAVITFFIKNSFQIYKYILGYSNTCHWNKMVSKYYMIRICNYDYTQILLFYKFSFFQLTTMLHLCKMYKNKHL
jgi:hypothetical protein